MPQIDRIEREHALLVEAIATSPGPVAIYDDEERLIAWNPAYAEIYADAFATYPDEIARHELRYEHILQAYAAGMNDRVEAERLVAERLREHRECLGVGVDRYHAKLGAWLRVSKFRTPSGAVAGFGMDVTELKEKSAELEAARAAEAEARIAAERATELKSRFIATLSHEIRTPLNGMLGMAAILRETDLDSRQREMLAVMERAGGQLMGVLNDVLDLARAEHDGVAVRAGAFQLSRLVADVAALFGPRAMERGQSISVRCSCDADWRLGDALRLRQVLSNLVSNAVKFAPDGEIRLSVEPVADDETGALVRFEVADEGPGMTPEEIEGLFVDFAQLGNAAAFGAAGSGLGLAICRRLVDAMRGRIEVSSRPGEGSRFAFVAPLPPRESEAPVAPEAPPPTGLDVLVVDDNEINRRVLAAMLAEFDCKVVEAESGPDALDAWRSGRFDVILMDSRMPGMSGAEAAGAIRELERRMGRSRSPILSISATSDPEETRALLDAGMDATLPKPIMRASLVEALRRVAPQRSSTAA